MVECKEMAADEQESVKKNNVSQWEIIPVFKY